MPRIFDVEQGSAEWFALRRGVITATRAQQLLERGKRGGYLEPRNDAIAEIAMERLDHLGKPTVTGAALRRGHEFEQDALNAYMFLTAQVVTPCGFALHDTFDGFGCSPDGLIGDDGMVQIKVPTSVKKHVQYLTTEIQAEEYQWQLTHEMYVMGRAWNDVVSYNPESPAKLEMAITRLHAPASWEPYEAMLMEADKAIEAKMEELNQIGAKDRLMDKAAAA